MLIPKLSPAHVCFLPHNVCSTHHNSGHSIMAPLFIILSLSILSAILISHVTHRRCYSIFIYHIYHSSYPCHTHRPSYTIMSAIHINFLTPSCVLFASPFSPHHVCYTHPTCLLFSSLFLPKMSTLFINIYSFLRVCYLYSSANHVCYPRILVLLCLISSSAFSHHVTPLSSIP